MILNNLEQKLWYNEKLCMSIANVIDMTAEANCLASKLESVETKIPVIKEKILSMAEDCITSCNQARDRVMADIYSVLLEKKCKNITEYMLKIHKTIDYCITNHWAYRSSQYREKYGDDRCVNLENLCLNIDELIIE